MKKLTLLLLLMVSTSVFAKWTEVGGNDDQTAYADLGTIKRKGHKVKMWSLSDLKTVQIFVGDNTRYLSSVVRREYDCEEEIMRRLDIHWYSGSMAGGEIVWSSTNIKNEATSILPGSISEAFFKIACGKK